MTFQEINFNSKSLSKIYKLYAKSPYYSHNLSGFLIKVRQNPNLLHFAYGSIAQSVEQETENLRVGGSIPPRATTLLFNHLPLLYIIFNNRRHLFLHTVVTIDTHYTSKESL